VAGVRDLSRHGFRMRAYGGESQLLWLLALGSIPAAVFGLLLDTWFEAHVRQPWLVALTLGAFGVLMLIADRRARLQRTIGDVGVIDAVVVGFAQACALVPGVSAPAPR